MVPSWNPTVSGNFDNVWPIDPGEPSQDLGSLGEGAAPRRIQRTTRKGEGVRLAPASSPVRKRMDRDYCPLGVKAATEW